MMEEDDLEYGPPTPFSYRDLFSRFFCSSDEGATVSAERSEVIEGNNQMEPPSAHTESPPEGTQGNESDSENGQMRDVEIVPVQEPIVMETGPEPEANLGAINDTAEKTQEYAQAPMHPDIMADVRTDHIAHVNKRQMSATTA